MEILVSIREIVAIFIEMFLAVIFYNTLFNKSRRENLWKYTIIILICSIIFERFKEINPLIVLILDLILMILCIAYVDKKDRYLTLIEILICVIVTFVIGNISSIVLYSFTSKIRELMSVLLGIVSIGYIFIILLLRYIIRKYDIDFEKSLEDNIYISNISMNLFMVFMIFKLVYDSGKFSNLIIIQINIFILINVFINIIFYRYLRTSIIKNKNTEVKNTYNPILDKMIDNIRANEHEYKNHINIIYSLVQISKSIEEAKEKTNKYMGQLGSTSLLNAIVQLDNTVVKAVLYSKLMECEKLGIEFEFSITADMGESGLDDTEITVILSNLLNNAIEATKNLEKDKKRVRLAVFKEEGEEDIEIEVVNKVDSTSKEFKNKMKKIFDKGVSTKGIGRGYGLYNVRKIVKKYNGLIESKIEGEDFYISILI